MPHHGLFQHFTPTEREGLQVKPKHVIYFCVVWFFVLIIASCGGGEDDEETGAVNPPTDKNGGVVRFDSLPDAEQAADLGEFKLRDRWRKDNLTYFIANFTNEISRADQRQIVSRAFQAWSGVSMLNFREVNSAQDADMVLGFGVGSHCNLYSVSNLQCPRGGGCKSDTCTLLLPAQKW